MRFHTAKCGARRAWRWRHARSLWGGLLLAGLVALPGAASEDEARVRLSGVFVTEQFVAGREVRIDSATLDDLFAAGATVVIDRTTGRDVTAAGASLRLRESRVEDLTLAGAEIDLGAEVGEDLIAAGGQVRQRAESVVRGYALVAGGDVELAGRIEGNLRAAGGRIRISGQVLGDADLSAGRITLEPGARIAGRLTYRSGAQADIASEAVVEGGIERLELEGPEFPVAAMVGIGIGAALVLLIGLGLIGAVLQAAVPELLAGAISGMSTRPWLSLGLGFAVLVATPVAVALLFVTIVGLPLGIFVSLVYWAALIGAAITAAYWLGSRLAGVFGWSYVGEPVPWRILWTALGLLVLAVLALVPFLGWLLLLLAFIWGLGGLTWRAGRMIHDWGRRPHGTLPA